jgi:uncharacterized membrane protein YphA (DoxX/SURF4 family)
MKLAKTILLWIIGILFIATGLSKLTHLDTMSATILQRANYPYWLFYAAGAFELIGGILLLIPKTRSFGALMIVIVMSGAIVTHVILKDSLVHAIVPALIILFSVSLLLKSKQS